MDKEYYVVYDKENDVYMERNDWGDGEIDEDSYSHPSKAGKFKVKEEAEVERLKYSNADELIVVKVRVTYEIEECV